MPKSPPAQTASSSSSRRRTPDCLETSMQLLHSSVEHAKAWDEAVRDKLCDNTNLNVTGITKPSGESAQWWVSLFQRLQETHLSDRQQWEKDLSKAKHQSQHLKEELRETIEERIAWLEEKFLEEIQQSAARNASDGISRASTASTAHDSSDSEREYYARRQQQSSRSTNSRQQFLSSRRGGAQAQDAAVEVSYDSAVALQRLDELERVVEQQQLEKSELSTVLEHATKVTQQGEQLSASMQQQLQLLLKEVDQTAQKQKKYYREKVATQKRLLQLLEQQHNNTVAEFNHEKEVLETTIVQLTADKAALQKQVDSMQAEHQKQRDDWEREKLTLQKVIQQFEGDYGSGHHHRLGSSPEGAFILSSTSEEYYADDVSSIHPSTIRHAASSPRSRVKWDENFDRAMVERDYFKQEAEQAKRELESIKSNQTVTSVGSDAGFVKELEKEVQHYKRQLDKELDHYRELAVNSQKELDDFKKKAQKELEATQKKLEEAQSESDAKVQQVRDEYKRLLNSQESEMQATISDLTNQLEGMDGEQRYRDSLEKRNGLATKLRQMERQRDDEKCEWKLRLEAVFSEKKKILEEKERLEKKMEEMERTFKAELKELEETIGQESQKWTECSTGAAEQNKRLVKELNKLTAQANAQDESIQKERKQWEELQQKYEKESQEIKAELQDLKTKASHEAEQLNIMLVAARLRCDEETEKSSKLSDEIADLRKALEASKSENLTIAEKASKHEENMKSLKKRLKEETHRLSTELQKSKDESRSLIDKTNELTRSLDSLRQDHRHAKDSLESLRKDHRQAKEKWNSEMQRVIDDKNSQIMDLRTQNSALIERFDAENMSKFDSETVFDAVEELRKDVVSIRETLENASVADKTIASANHIQLSDEIVLIQSSLNDALAEITLGSEAMMEVKEIVDEVCRTVKARSSPQQDLQLQPDVLAEIRLLREQLAVIVNGQRDGVHLLNDSIRKELATDLQNKESQIVSLTARLEQLQVELASEKEKLSSAEHEIVTLNDQADAYGEELMRMQALNAGLEETLRATERKMEEAIRNYDEYAGEWGHSRKKEEDSSPLLDEALALAQGLTDLVHGRDEDADVMDMLQSLSDLMDQHERGEWPPTQRSDDSPESRDEAPPGNQPRRNDDPLSTPNHPKSNRPSSRPPLSSSSGSSFRVDGSSAKLENPPEPVRSPEMSPPSAGRDFYGIGATTTLQTIVEQLYARCQILERERTQMMTVTVDLLTSARQANEAELDAALATARRRSAEEILRVRHETSMEKERLFHKLCGKCAQGLLLAHKPNQEAPSARTAATTATAMVVSAAPTTSVRG